MHAYCIVSHRHNTAAVWLGSNDAQVWSWGDNDAGQLGHGDMRARHTPQHINTLQSLRVQGSIGGYRCACERACKRIGRLCIHLEVFVWSIGCM